MPETPQRELAFISHPFERFWVVEFFLTGHVLPFQRVPLTTTVIADPNTIKSISSLPALTHVSSPPAGGELSSVKTLMNVSSPLSCGELSLIKKKHLRRPALDLRRMNRGLIWRPFRMLTDPRANTAEDWFLSVDLKDTYFHIRFDFEGVAYQYTVLQFGLSQAPRKVRRRGSFPSETDGNPHTELPRWLASASQLRTTIDRSQVIVAQPPRASWVQNQPSQEFSNSQTTSVLPGNSHRLCSKASLDCIGKLPDYTASDGVFQDGDIASPQSISEEAWPQDTLRHLWSG